MAMKLIVTGRQLAVTEAIREDIDKRFRKLERMLNDSAVSGQCVLAREKRGFICDITVHARGDHTLHAVGRHPQLSAAVGAAADKIGQQAHKLADRWKRRRKGGPRSAEVAPGPELLPAPAPDSGPRVIRARAAAVKPMSLDDAVVALASGERAFLVYRDTGSDALAILFRRPDGNYGLIEA
jgi:putative sigma-54 modulation protein